MQPVQDSDGGRPREPHAVSVLDGGCRCAGTGAVDAKACGQADTLPELRDVATDQLNNGLKTNITIDRDTASRLGIFPQAIDNTLYDAFGQRQVSTIFTQLNQYHVILEVLPSFAQDARRIWKDIYIRPSTVTPNSGAPTANGAAVTTSGAPVPISTFTNAIDQHFAGGEPPGAVPGGDAFVQSRARRFAGRRYQGHPAGGEGNSAAAQHHTAFQGTAAAFQNSLASEPYLILAAVITVYIVLGVLYESYIHPITILSTLPSAGVGAILALHDHAQRSDGGGADRHHSSDRHREEKRHHDDRLCAGSGARGTQAAGGSDLIRRVCCASVPS
jgi:multidrug efflux pump subunit AcrB